MDVGSIKKQFPLYTSHPQLIYLDSCATTLKPQVVLDKMNEYYCEYGVNIHRGVYRLSYQASKAYEEAREVVAEFIHAKPNEVVFTRNVTDALNKICLMLKNHITKEDEIVVTEVEHHSSLLPWQHHFPDQIRYLPLTSTKRITLEGLKTVVTDHTKILAVTYVSNVLGTITPLKELIQYAHEKGILVIVDAAQAMSHIPVDVQALDCDFLAFSGHKMFGPTGVGVLFGKETILNSLDPIEYGGDMNEEVTHYKTTIKPIPYRFEAGTPMIAEAIGLKAAIHFIQAIGFDAIFHHEQRLMTYLDQHLKDIDGIEIYNQDRDLAILAFNIQGVHPHDASTLFDEKNIALRAGHHCAQLITTQFSKTGTLRASFHIYNDEQDIDRFIETLKETIQYFKKF